MAGRTIAATMAVLGMAALATLGLAGCTSNPVQATARPASDSSSAPAGETPAPSSKPAPSPTATGPTTTPVTQTCDQLVTIDDLYAFNPNYAADPKYTPAAGSDAALIASYHGIACGWVNLSSKMTIEIAVAHLSAADIEKIQNALVVSMPSVPTYGGVDYFENKDGIGTAEVFSGDYWIVARSADFFEPGDPESLIAAVKAHLG